MTSKHLKNLDSFKCTILWGLLPSEEELKKQLDGYSIRIVERESDDDEMSFIVQLPDHFPPGVSLSGVLRKYDICNIDYF